MRHFSIHAWFLLFGVLSLFGDGGCGPLGVEREARDREAGEVLECTAKELCDLGFEQEGEALLVRGFQERIDPCAALRTARWFEEKAGPGSAAGLLSMFYPRAVPEPVEEERVRSLVHGWRWSDAAPLLAGASRGGTGAVVGDVLNRNRRLSEPFQGRSPVLSWKIRGWRWKNEGDRLLLVTPTPWAGGEENTMECSTTVGWNGRSFRVQARLFLVPFRCRTGGFFFGLSSEGKGGAEGVDLGVLFRGGMTRLCCGRARTKVEGTEKAPPAWRGWWPCGRWLCVTVEYLAPSMEDLDPESSPGRPEGRFRAWVEDQARGCRLFTLETRAAPFFGEGTAAVGFPSWSGETGPPVPGFALYMDDFLFEN